MEMNVSCLERGGMVCSQREGEGVTEAMRKHKLTVGWLPQLRVDPFGEGRGCMAPRYFRTSSEHVEFDINV